MHHKTVDSASSVKLVQPSCEPHTRVDCRAPVSVCSTVHGVGMDATASVLAGAHHATNVGPSPRPRHAKTHRARGARRPAWTTRPSPRAVLDANVVAHTASAAEASSETVSFALAAGLAGAAPLVFTLMRDTSCVPGRRTAVASRVCCFSSLQNFCCSADQAALDTHPTPPSGSSTCPLKKRTRYWRSKMQFCWTCDGHQVERNKHCPPA